MKNLFLIGLMFFSIASSAQAEVFVWEDPKFDITLTYPDDWMYQKTEKTQARLHIIAPQGQDEAACRVMASNDNRFLYVPPQGAVQVAQFVQDENALKGIFANHLHYNDVRLVKYVDLASLGKGPATMAVAQYYKSVGEQQVPMQSIVFGGYVQGLETIFQCESAANSWDKWQTVFMNIAATLDFPVRTAALKNGYYRDFIADGYVYFPMGNQQGIAQY